MIVKPHKYLYLGGIEHLAEYLLTFVDKRADTVVLFKQGI